MYVDTPSDTWDATTWADLGIPAFKPCVLKAKIIRTSLLSSTSAQSYVNGSSDDLINMINAEGYAEVSLIEPLDTFIELELKDTFEVHKCVFDSGFFHLKRSIEGNEYQGISNCPWLAFNPEDVVFILYNKSQETPLEDRLIIVGHAQDTEQNPLSKFISLPPRTGFVGDYYTNYDFEAENCFFGIRDNYLIKYDANYSDYGVTVAAHGTCNPVTSVANFYNSYSSSFDYPNGMLVQVFLSTKQYNSYLSTVNWKIRWFGPRQFHTMKDTLAYREYSGSTRLQLDNSTNDYPFITTTVNNSLWGRMFDYGNGYDAIIANKEFDSDGFLIGINMTSETIPGYSDISGDTSIGGSNMAIKSDAAGVVWSTRHERSPYSSAVNATRYTLYVWVNGSLYFNYSRVLQSKYPSGAIIRGITGSWRVYLYMNVDADIYVYYEEVYTGSSDPWDTAETSQLTVYLQQGNSITALSTASGTGVPGATTGQTDCSLKLELLSKIPYLVLSYRPYYTYHGIKQFCDLTTNDRGDICFITVPTAGQIVDPITFTFASRVSHVVIAGKLLASPIDIATFDYLDLDTV